MHGPLNVKFDILNSSYHYDIKCTKIQDIVCI